MTLAVFCLTHTDCGHPVRKSSGQFHRGVLKPRGPSYHTSVLPLDGGDGIVGGAVWPVGKLEGVERGRKSGDDQPLKALHHNGNEYDGLVVIECCV